MFSFRLLSVGPGSCVKTARAERADPSGARLLLLCCKTITFECLSQPDVFCATEQNVGGNTRWNALWCCASNYICLYEFQLGLYQISQRDSVNLFIKEL